MIRRDGSRRTAAIVIAVLRDGQVRRLPSAELVRGDVLGQSNLTD